MLHLAVPLAATIPIVLVGSLPAEEPGGLQAAAANGDHLTLQKVSHGVMVFLDVQQPLQR